MDNNTNNAPQTTPAAAAPAKSGKKLGIIIGASVVGALIIAAIAVVLSVNGQIAKAESLLEQGDYASARAIFEKYGSNEENLLECDYAEAQALADSGDYTSARDKFLALNDYKDSADQADAAYYAYAGELLEEGKLEEAIDAYTALPEGYEDSAEQINVCRYAIAEQYYNDGNFSEAATAFAILGDYEDANERSTDSMIQSGIALYHAGDYDAAEIVLDRYFEDYEIAEVYSYLTLFQKYKASNTLDYMDSGLYLILSDYVDDYPDVAAVMDDPYFYFARFCGAGWKFEGYTIDLDTEKGTIFFYVPWTTMGGTPGYTLEGDRMLVLSGDDPWFYITGFSSYDEKHPDKVYLEDLFGKEYTFKRYTVFDE